MSGLFLFIAKILLGKEVTEMIVVVYATLIVDGYKKLDDIKSPTLRAKVAEMVKQLLGE